MVGEEEAVGEEDTRTGVDESAADEDEDEEDEDEDEGVDGVEIAVVSGIGTGTCEVYAWVVEA